MILTVIKLLLAHVVQNTFSCQGEFLSDAYTITCRNYIVHTVLKDESRQVIM